MHRRPLPVGESRVGPTVDARGVMKKYPLRLGLAHSLAPLVADYVFFTPAPLYLHGRFTDAPLADFVHEMRTDVRFFFKKFERAIFAGLETLDGDTDWNHVLWAVERPYWDAQAGFLCSVCLSDAEHGRAYRFGLQEFVVTDPRAHDVARLYHDGLPRLAVGAFGVNASHLRAAFEVGPLCVPPPLRFYPPAPEVRAFARALFGGDNPVLAQESHTRNKETP